MADSPPGRLSDTGDLLREILSGCGERTQSAVDCVDVVTATYGAGGAEGDVTAGSIRCQRLQVGGDPEQSDEVAKAVGTSSVFSSLETALTALERWILRRDGSGTPVLVIHVTSGGFRCCADVERAAGTLKMACDFRGAPGVFYNLLIGGEATLAFPAKEMIDGGAAGVVKTLYRMASPVGEWGAGLLSCLGITCGPGARFFETVRTFGASLAPRLTALFISESIRDTKGKGGSGITVCAFVAPKEGEVIENCDDVVSIHRSRQRFVVSDGAATASYSAEWARALCRHAVESPPPALGGGEAAEEDAGRLGQWLERALEYWTPEVPWERLLRPALFNKAKEGSGASLAGVELLEVCAGEGVKWRAWALGDSCVIHLRGNQVVSSKPMDRSAKFSHVPALLMTLPGYEAKYVRFWENWESVLSPGDLLVLGTDALCEYMLGALESGDGAEVVSWLAGLSSGSGGDEWGRFEEFVGARRRDGQMKNDDVGLIIVEAR